MRKTRIPIRDHTAEANLFARRSFIAILIVLAMLLLIVSNLYSLQITNYESYQTRSNGNRIKVLPVAPNRGLVYDRNGILLAENRPVFSLELIPEQIDDLDTTLAEISDLLGFAQDRVEDFKDDLKRQRRFKPVTLKRNLNADEVALFSAHQHRFPGAFIDARLSRHYPYADALTHMLGYVARINKKDLQKLSEAGLEEQYAATHDIGKLGVEKFHEAKLHGEVGYQEVEVNNQGRIIRTLSFEPPTPGTDLVLNIDVKLQLEARKALQDRRGAIVILDPSDGGVMALYSNPSYDPNLFVNGISSKNYRQLINSKDLPLINRTTQGQYPPASTIKPHLALLGLEEGIVNEKSRVFDNGSYRLKNVSHVWRDWWRAGHGWVDARKAIEVSCDIYFYDLAYRLGIDRISTGMQEFGFGDYTGIDIYEEYPATMPSRGWKRAQINEPWYIGDTIPVGIGQGFWTTTPLQLAQSVSALINKGTRYVPQLLRGELVNGVTRFEEAKELRPIAMRDEANWDLVLSSMHGVNHNQEHGSARSAFRNAKYISGGKTGTAQLVSIAQGEEYDEEKVAERHRDNAMYVGYAPYDKPEMIVVVVLENAGGGGKNAAPIARQMMDYYFRDRTFPELVQNSENNDEAIN